ncbi:MAG: hypothetical protein AAGC55_17820 [Myxococcota bacterium]
MPDYSKLHEFVSHRVNIEYDTGVRITGYLEACHPGSGQVQFAKLTSVQLIDAEGGVVDELDDLTVCPNVLTGFHLDEGPRGRDL